MTNIRRYYSEGYTYFTTNVTFERHPILAGNEQLLIDSIEKIRLATSFDLIAWVILPEHFHVIIQPKDVNISFITRRIKLSYSSKYRQMNKLYSGQLWQNRFWDRVIRDQDDLNRHINYIHHNPEKHGLVSNPFDYPYSSIHQYKEFYPEGWGTKEDFGDFGFGE